MIAPDFCMDKEYPERNPTTPPQPASLPDDKKMNMNSAIPEQIKQDIYAALCKFAHFQGIAGNRMNDNVPLDSLHAELLTALAPHFTQQGEDADRWHFVACSPQTALMLGTKADPNAKDFPWRDECDRLVDAARLNTEIKTK